MTSTWVPEETTFIFATSVKQTVMRAVALTTISIASLWLSLGVAYGQAIPNSVAVTPSRASYKFAAGLRFSTFGHKESSLSGKYFLTSKAALHLTIGRFVDGPKNLSVTALYERYHPLFQLKNLQYLYGAGLSASFPKVLGETRLSNAETYAGVTLGVEYTVGALPLAIGVDFRQMFALSQYSSTLIESHNLAVSAHYLFK